MLEEVSCWILKLEKKKKKIGTRTYIERRSNMMIVDNLLE